MMSAVSAIRIPRMTILAVSKIAQEHTTATAMPTVAGSVMIIRSMTIRPARRTVTTTGAALLIPTNARAVLAVTPASPTAPKIAQACGTAPLMLMHAEAVSRMPTASRPVARIALALSVEQLTQTTAALAFRVRPAHFPAPWIATVNGVEQPVQTYAAYAPGAAPVSAPVFKTVMDSGAV